MTSPNAISQNEWQNLFRFAYSLCQQRENALSLLHGAIERLRRVKTTQPLQLDAYLRQVMLAHPGGMALLIALLPILAQMSLASEPVMAAPPCYNKLSFTPKTFGQGRW